MLYTTDTSATVKKTLAAPGPAKALRLSPWGNAGPGFSGAGLHGERDEGNGLYMLGAGYRGYLPALRRFNAPDSWSPFGRGGINAYAFCGGDPVNRRDPSGHGFFSKLKTIYQNGLLAKKATSSSLDSISLASSSLASSSRRSSLSPVSSGEPQFFRDLAHHEPAARHLVSYLDSDTLLDLAEVSPSMRPFTRAPIFEEDRLLAIHAAEIYRGSRLTHHARYPSNYDMWVLYYPTNQRPEYYAAASWITGMGDMHMHLTDPSYRPARNAVTHRFIRFNNGIAALRRDIPEDRYGIYDSVTAARIANPEFWAFISSR